MNQNGIEVPSYIIDEATSGLSVSAALLLFFVTIGGNTTQSLWIYYGNVEVGLPPYRVQSPTGSIKQGALSVSLGSQAGTSSVGVGFRSTYFQQFEPSLSVGSASKSFGAKGLAAASFNISTPWHSVGSDLGSSLAAAAATFVAGQVRYSRVVIATNSSVTMLDGFLNQGNGSVQGLSYTMLVDDTQLATLGLTSTYFTPSGLVSSFTSGAYIQLATQPAPNSFTVGNLTAVASQVFAGNLRGQSIVTGPSAAALRWNLGTIASKGWASISQTWGISSTPGAPATPGPNQGPKVTLGTEQVSTSFAPLVNGLWETDVKITDTTVPPSGIILPLAVNGTTVLTDSASVAGTVGYSVAYGDFTAGSSEGWQSYSSSTGKGVAYASPAFWSVPEGREVGRVVVASPNSASTGAASLVSGIGTVYRQGQVELRMTYRANLSLVAGNPSAQQLYAALEIGGPGNGAFSQTLVFPVAGTASPVAGEACGQQAGQGASDLTGVHVAGYLIGDGTWRTLIFNLSKWISSADTQVQLTFCATTGGSFEGQMELQLTSAGVQVSAPASEYLVASVDSLTSTMTISQTRSLASSTQGITANIDVGFAVASASRLGESQEGVFSSMIPRPALVALESSSPGNSLSPLPLSLAGIIFYTQFSSLSPKLEVNGTAVGPLTLSNGSISTPLDFKRPFISVKDPSYSLSLGGYAVALSTIDSSGNPAGGVDITLAAGQPPLVMSATTNAEGSASFVLLPGDYQLTASIQGFKALGSSVSVNSDSNLTLTVNVFSITVRVVDALGRPVPDATVSISHGNFTMAGTTNSAGDYDALLVANGLYQVTAGTRGINYYSGTISVSANNEVVSAKMQYYPLSLQLEVAGVVLAILVAAALILFRPGRISAVFRGRV